MQMSLVPNTKAYVASRIEALVYKFNHVLNTRDFNIDSPIWTLCSDNFKVQHQGTEQFNTEQCIAEIKQSTRRYPEYYARLYSVSVQIDDSGDHATAILDLEITGYPPGVVKYDISICEFRLEKKRWLLTSYCTTMAFSGMPSVP